MGPAKYREIKFGKEARESIKRGVDIAANAVKVTMGVTGKAVIIEDPLDQGAPMVADDGVTVAKSVLLKDRFENLGAEMIKEVANKTNETAGDGTTTATVLAQAMLNGAFEAMEQPLMPIQPMELKAQMGKAVEKVKEELNKIKRECTSEDIEKVATISSLDLEVGKLIADVFSEVGGDGVITLETSQKVGLEKEVVMGLRFTSGYVSPYMINNPQKANMVINSPKIFITAEKIHHNDELIPILNAALQEGYHDILIICNDMDGEALTTILANELHLIGPGGKQGNMTIGVAKAPMFGQEQEEWLHDVAVITGATVFTKKTGMKFLDGSQGSGKIADSKWFGKAHRAILNRFDTTIIEGGGEKEKIFKKSEEIRQLLKDNPNFDEYDKKRHEKRIANLISGIGVIKVGAYTKTELDSRLYKIEDALNAAKCAIKEGIVIGGGSALAKIGASMLPTENIGEQIVAIALGAPLKQMAENKGMDVNTVTNDVVTSPEQMGYDFKTGEFCDLFTRGVVDPVKVTRLALENACSIVSTIISAEAAFVAVREKDEKNSN